MMRSNESLTTGSLVAGSLDKENHIECRGNVDLSRSTPEKSQALDNVRNTFYQAIVQVLRSGDLEQLQLPKEDHIQLKFTIKNGQITYGD